MNPYLQLLKEKKRQTRALTELTKAPSVSFVSDQGEPFSKSQILETEQLTKEQWLEMITELDRLIAAYCAKHMLGDAAVERILKVRRKQALTSIPETLTWFRNELKDYKP